jgi:carboxymethylenebutenolidase
MEPTRPKLPGEAIELYNQFIHGYIDRRAFLDGVQRFAVGGPGDYRSVDAELRSRPASVQDR